MTIEKNLNGTELTVAIVGRLDTTTAPQLEAEFKQNIGGIEKLVLDFASLEYLSSFHTFLQWLSFYNIPGKRFLLDAACLFSLE